MLRPYNRPSVMRVIGGKSPLDFCFGFVDALFKSTYGRVRLLFVDEEWRRQSDGVLARAEDA